MSIVEGSDSEVVADSVAVWGSFDTRSAGRSPGIDAASCYGSPLGAWGVTSTSLFTCHVIDVDSDCRVYDGCLPAASALEPDEPSFLLSV